MEPIKNSRRGEKGKKRGADTKGHFECSITLCPVVCFYGAPGICYPMFYVTLSSLLTNTSFPMKLLILRSTYSVSKDVQLFSSIYRTRLSRGYPHESFSSFNACLDDLKKVIRDR